MNRFFKILREDGGVADIICDENAERAEMRAMFRPWHNAFCNFRVVETTRDEWWTWSVTNWAEVDRLEADMTSLDTF